MDRDAKGFIYYMKKYPRAGELPEGTYMYETYPEKRYIKDVDIMACGELHCSRRLAPWEVCRYELISAPVDNEAIWMD